MSLTLSASGLALQVAVYSNRPYMCNNINKVLTTSHCNALLKADRV
jgi:hypothetical protein